MAALPAIATAATAVAAVVGAGAGLYSGYLSYQSGQEQAKALEAAGKEEFAVSQREAMDRRLEGQIIMSRQQAAAAASGGGAGVEAPTIVRLMTETAQAAEYGAQGALYSGEARKNTYFASAEAARKTGVNNFIGSVLSGFGTLLGGAGQTAAVADKYGLMPSYSSGGGNAFAGSGALG